MTDEPTDSADSQPTDSRLTSFLRQATAIIGVEKGLNAASRVKLQTLAKHVKLPPKLFDEALAHLQSSTAISHLSHYEKAFVKHLEGEFEKIPGGVLSPGMENKAIELAGRKYQINGTRAEQLVQVVADSQGVGRVSLSESESFARQTIVEQIGDRIEIDEPLRQRIDKIGRTWGLANEQTKQIIVQRIVANKANRKSGRGKFVLLSTICVLAVAGLGGVLWFYFSEGRFAQVDVPNIDKPPPVQPVDSWLGPRAQAEFDSFQLSDPAVKAAMKSVLSADPVMRRDGYQQLVRIECDPILVPSSRLSDVLAFFFAIEPDDPTAFEIPESTARLMDSPSGEPPTIVGIRRSYRANHLFGKLYFDRAKQTVDRYPLSSKRKAEVDRLIQSSLGISIEKSSNLTSYVEESESVLARNQWNSVLQASWTAPSEMAILVPPLFDLSRARLNQKLLNQLRDEVLVSILRTDTTRWKILEHLIRDSIAASDQVKLADWISIFESSENRELSDAIGPWILNRFAGVPDSSRPSEIAETISEYGLAYRNRLLQPVIERNQTLDQRVELALKGDREVTADLIAQFALSVNLELAFCAAIDNATLINDDSFLEFDRLLAAPYLRLRELVSLPIDRGSRTASRPGAATASDNRRMAASMERLADLTPEASGLRQLAINQLERVAPRFARISYHDAEIMASYLLSNLPEKEQLNVEKQIGAFAHWPNLFLALADQLPASGVNIDQALTLVRLLTGREIELTQGADWKTGLQSSLLAAVQDDLKKQIDLDPDNVKSNWIRLQIHLTETYRQRRVIGLNGRFHLPSTDSPFEPTLDFIRGTVERNGNRFTKGTVLRAVALIRQAEVNDLEKTILANQLLIQVLGAEIQSVSDGAVEALITRLDQELEEKKLAGEQLYLTERALFQLAAMKRQQMVSQLLKK